MRAERTYVLARSRSKKAMLQHVLSEFGEQSTACGVDMLGTSRSYTSSRFDAIFCKRCAQNLGVMLQLDN